MCTNHGAVVWWLSVGAHNAGIEGSNPEWLIMKAVGERSNGSYIRKFCYAQQWLNTDKEPETSCAGFESDTWGERVQRQGIQPKNFSHQLMELNEQRQ